jgi:hypothetical protein
VRYGFELATYAAGWVPYVGWLSGQIMIFYNFGERITHAIVHNTLDWLNGNGSFLFNVGEGLAWTIDAFIQLGIDEWNYFLPPLPPLPPFPFAAAATTAETTAATTAAVDTAPPSEQRSAAVADDQSTDAVDKKADVDVAKETKKPKKVESTTDVTGQDEIGAAPDTTKVSKGEKKGDAGPTTKGATDSSKSTAGKNDNKKNDDNGKKKADKE